MPVDEIRRRMGETFGLAPDELTELQADLAGDMRLDTKLVRFIAEIRGSYRVGILSNNDQPGARAELNARFGLEALVDSVVLSGEVGFDKPHPAIYRAAADQLGVAADACVFVDDSPGHVAGARAAGMTAFVHTDPDSTVTALRELLGQR